MADDKKNGNGRLSLLITAGGLLLSIAGVWGTLSAEQADVKRRVDTVEKRQTEDRAETKERLRDVNHKADRIDANVQIILRKLDAMEAARQAERRERTR